MQGPRLRDAALLLRLLRRVPHARLALCPEAAQLRPQAPRQRVSPSPLPDPCPYRLGVRVPACARPETASRLHLCQSCTFMSSMVKGVHAVSGRCRAVRASRRPLSCRAALDPHLVPERDPRVASCLSRHHVQVKDYFAQFVTKKAQSIIDDIIARRARPTSPLASLGPRSQRRASAGTRSEPPPLLLRRSGGTVRGRSTSRRRTARSSVLRGPTGSLPVPSGGPPRAPSARAPGPLNHVRDTGHPYARPPPSGMPPGAPPPGYPGAPPPGYPGAPPPGYPGGPPPGMMPPGAPPPGYGAPPPGYGGPPPGGPPPGGPPPAGGPPPS